MLEYLLLIEAFCWLDIIVGRDTIVGQALLLATAIVARCYCFSQCYRRCETSVVCRHHCCFVETIDDQNIHCWSILMVGSDTTVGSDYIVGSDAIVDYCLFSLPHLGRMVIQKRASRQ